MNSQHITETSSPTMGRLPDFEPVGIIDIGSNTVRLVIFEGLKRNLTPIFNDKVTCGLGSMLASEGIMGKQNIKLALSAIKRFRLVLEITKVNELYVIATAAAREAKNGKIFIKQVENIIKTDVNILTGQEEAYFAAQGILAGFPNQNGLVGDLGGGSLELVNISNNKTNGPVTLPLGTLRLLDKSKNKLDIAEKEIIKQLSNLEVIKNSDKEVFFAVGGSWRALARAYMNYMDYPLHVLHNYIITAADLIEFCNIVRNLPLRILMKKSGISNNRINTLPIAALLMEQVLKISKVKKVCFSALGVREGFLFSRLENNYKKADPLLKACEELTILRSRSTDYALELCNWNDKLLESNFFQESQNERRLRHAACLLSDIGWRAHPDYRGEQSMNIIANASFVSITHSERVFIAYAVYFGHEGVGEATLSSNLKTLIDWKTLERARLIGVLIKLGENIAAAVPGILPKTKLYLKNNKLTLVLPKELKALKGVSLQSNMQKAANLIDIEYKIKVV